MEMLRPVMFCWYLILLGANPLANPPQNKKVSQESSSAHHRLHGFLRDFSLIARNRVLFARVFRVDGLSPL